MRVKHSASTSPDSLTNGGATAYARRGEGRFPPRRLRAILRPCKTSAAAYLPAQRHFVLDARHVGVEDLPEPNLVTAVVRLEQTRTPWDLVEVARRLRRWLRRPDDDGLRRVLGSWVREVAESFAPPGEALGAELTLEEVEMTVVERAKEWSRQLIREGREQGLEQGLEQGPAAGDAPGRGYWRDIAPRRRPGLRAPAPFADGRTRGEARGYSAVVPNAPLMRPSWP